MGGLIASPKVSNSPPDEAIRDLFKPEPVALAAVAAKLLLFAVRWTRSWRYDQLWSPSNLTYLDFVATHQEAASFIESRYPDRTVLAGWPQYIELSMPSLGYVCRPVRVVAYALPVRFEGPRMLQLGARSFIDPRSLSSDDFGLVYFAENTGHADAAILRDIILRSGFPVIAEFRVHDQRVTIYGNPRRIDVLAWATG